MVSTSNGALATVCRQQGEGGLSGEGQKLAHTDLHAPLALCKDPHAPHSSPYNTHHEQATQVPHGA